MDPRMPQESPQPPQAPQVTPPPAEQPVPQAPAAVPQPTEPVLPPAAPSLVESPPQLPVEPSTPESAPLDTPEAQENHNQSADDQPEAVPQESETPQPSDEQPQTPAQPPKELPTLQWEASESVHYDKSPAWYVGLSVVAVLAAIVAVFLLDLWSFAVLIIVMAVSVMLLSSKPPRQLQYRLDTAGLSVQEKQYPLEGFRAFAVVQEGSMFYIKMIPLKRFMPPLEIFFPTEYGDDIIAILGSRIPMQTYKRDLLDAMTRRLRF